MYNEHLLIRGGCNLRLLRCAGNCVSLITCVGYT